MRYGGSRNSPRSRLVRIQINGVIGIRDEFDIDAWQLKVMGPDGARIGTHDLADIGALPKFDTTIERKCIEG